MFYKYNIIFLIFQYFLHIFLHFSSLVYAKFCILKQSQLICFGQTFKNAAGFKDFDNSL
jgi:hypothetical protein